MSERTVMIFSKVHCFVGKMDEDTMIVNGLVMCSFIMAQTNQGPVQLVGLRKLGKMDMSMSTGVDLVIDLEPDSDVYMDYVRLTTGVKIETAMSMPKPPIKH